MDTPTILKIKPTQTQGNVTPDQMNQTMPPIHGAPPGLQLDGKTNILNFTGRNQIMSYLDSRRQLSKKMLHDLTKSLAAYAHEDPAFKEILKNLKTYATIDSSIVEKSLITAEINAYLTLIKNLKNYIACNQKNKDTARALYMQITAHVNGSLKVPPRDTLPAPVIGENIKLGSGQKYCDMSEFPLFPHEPTVNDIRQGNIGDCYLLASLSSIAAQTPEVIKQCMRDNGDGTVTVRFFKDRMPLYVTVDKVIPQYRFTGKDVGAKDCLWVQMIERAYVASGLNTPDMPQEQHFQTVYNRTQSDLTAKEKAISNARTELKQAKIESEKKNAQTKLDKAIKAYTDYKNYNLPKYLIDENKNLSPRYVLNYNHISGGQPHNFFPALLGTVPDTEDNKKIRILKLNRDIYELVMDEIKSDIQQKIPSYKNDHSSDPDITPDFAELFYRTQIKDTRIDERKKQDIMNFLLGITGRLSSGIAETTNNSAVLNQEIIEQKLTNQLSELENFKTDWEKKFNTADRLNTVNEVWDKILQYVLDVMRRKWWLQEIIASPPLHSASYSIKQLHLFETIQDAVARDEYIIISSKPIDENTSGQNNEGEKAGIYGTHAYCVFDAALYNIGDKTYRFLLVRNPWAHGVRQYYFNKNTQTLDALEGKEDNEGFFWMELSDLTEIFSQVNIIASRPS